MNLIMVCGMFVWCANVCMLTVSNALLMSSATVIVRSDGLLWLKPVVMMLFIMLCSAVLVEWLLLKPCCVECCL